MMFQLLMKFPGVQPVSYYPRRRFWAWLNVVWNRVDEARIKAVGPDVACAEWLLRNGAFVKWVGDYSYTEDYNELPSIKGNSSGPRYIEEVNATESSIMHIGFPHFAGCKHIKKMTFHRCAHIENTALKMLSLVKESLQDLQVSSCGNVGDEGVLSLQTLSKLRKLNLFDLPEVKNPQECLQILKTSLPQCDINFQVNADSVAEKKKETKKDTLDKE